MAEPLGSMSPQAHSCILSVGAGDNKGGLQHVRLQLAQCKVTACQGWRQTDNPQLQYWHSRLRCAGGCQHSSLCSSGNGAGLCQSGKLSAARLAWLESKYSQADDGHLSANQQGQPAHTS